MDAQELLDQIFELAPTKDPRSALAIGDREIEFITSRPANPQDAETCRLLAAAAAELAQYDVAATWRRRALLRGAIIGWTELIAACTVSDAFIALGRRNDNYARGRTLDVIQGEPEALQILADLEPFAVEPGSGISATTRSPTPALIRRWILEKRGAFELALGEYSAAAATYAEAVTSAEGARAKLKTGLGLALAEYLVALNDGDEVGTVAALSTTTATGQDASDTGELDLAQIARQNAVVMRRSGRDLLLYEIL